MHCDGGPLTGHTFTAHTAACAAGAAVQSIIKRDHLVERVRTEGEVFKALLSDALGNLEAVGNIRGRGFFIGVEFVADRAGKSPFDAGMELSARINEQAISRGLLCYAVSGTVDGTRGDAIILAPPYIATRDELVEIVQTFADCTIAALREVGQA